MRAGDRDWETELAVFLKMHGSLKITVPLNLSFLIRSSNAQKIFE